MTGPASVSRPTILTVSLNAALDTTYFVDRFRPGDIHAASRVLALPGGKANNVARVLAALGERVVATGFAGGHTGARIREGLRALGVADEYVELPQESRTCLAIVDEARRLVTEVREPGPAVEPERQAALVERFQELLPRAGLVVISGSLPPGTPGDFYGRLIAVAHAAGVRCLLDASGAALRGGLEARPFAVKPNRDELAQWSGIPLPALADVCEAASRLADAGGAAWTVVSLGSDGLLAHVDGRRWRVRPPRVAAVNPVGSGDALVAGLAAAIVRGLPVLDALALGVACGAANAATPGVAEVSAADVAELRARVTVEPADDRL